MNEKLDSKSSVQSNPLTITRSFDAPRERVFNAFTQADLLKQWWGPKDFTSPSFETDPRVGGKYLGCMRTPEGKDMWSTGTYIEFKSPEKLKYTDSFADKNGKVVPATYYDMSPDFPMECVVELSFMKEGDGTTLSLKHFGIPKSDIEDCTSGWNQCLDKLQTLVEKSNDARSYQSQSTSTDSNISI